MRLLVAPLLIALPFAPHAQADWPAWRGPDANAVAPAGNYPVNFGPGTNERWSVDLPGQGTSTPIVSGDAIFVTAVDADRNVLCCYGLDGQEQWRRDLGAADEGKHRSATGSNPSPVADAGHVVAYFKSGDLACFDRAGERLWQVNLQEEYGNDTLWWDLGTSPVLTSAGAVIAVMQAGDSFLVTFDLDSGEVVWKQDRLYDRPEESDQAYTTPAVAWLDGKETVVTWGADYLTGHDAATGQLLWQQDGFNPENKAMWRVIASATIDGGVAYLPYGRGDYVAGVPLGGAAATSAVDAASSPRRWDTRGVGADVPSPVVHNGRVYVLGDGGEVACLAAKDGEVLWRDRLPRNRNKFYSSPLLANGRLYCLREDGAAFVVDTTDGYELVAENKLGDETVSTPVPVNNGLLIRTRTKLFLFGEGES